MANALPYEIKNRLIKLRKRLGLTQEEFASKAGLKQSQISGYENGSRSISDTAYELMYNHLKVNRAWLEKGIGKMFSEEVPMRQYQPKIDELGDRLRFIRKQAKLTLEKMSKELSVSQSNLSKYENGSVTIPNTIVMLLNTKFNVRHDWFFTGKENPYNTEPEKKSVMIDIQSIQQQLTTIASHAKAQEKEIFKLKGRVTELEKELKLVKLTKQYN